ncbi:hypothetical protein BDV96DRAFT_561361 [Lophiotrema nucula]|uniref:Alpha/beta hydrolase fold-3 domain-containing protein n=1 Tax=Lophiotrema nucula TaxID=690887 RepID=A0A6A5ZWM6_9PLEO|nr:hypothetical protein BDV96DRAFT_561361 [Lophiotrema nucula]
MYNSQVNSFGCRDHGVASPDDSVKIRRIYDVQNVSDEATLPYACRKLVSAYVHCVQYALVHKVVESDGSIVIEKVDYSRFDRKGHNFPVWADLRGLPPAYLPMDECDPIRDQGFLYAELLAEAGVKTRTDF